MPKQPMLSFPLDLPSERRTLTSVAELCAVLEHDFRLRLPEGPALEDALAPLVAAT